ncbi:MAG: polymerase sigma-E factor [Phenylobacterium sp.]|jgi:RNA polymerase sigma factor (sigma-70 family)|nr:polymerase sigma-E factor [Phenylobacterium sp.]
MVRGQGVAGERDRTPARSDRDGEAQLIARVRRRDLRAFEKLYRDYHPRLTRFLTNLIHRPNLVEEVLDDTMLVVWNRPDGYNGASKLSTWIFAIAYRKALNALQRQDEPLEDKHPEIRASAEAGPEQQVGGRQVQEVLLRAMRELSPDHRAVVDLTYFHEIGYREIAAIMECPVDTVKTRMYYARRHLKRMLDGGLADWL